MIRHWPGEHRNDQYFNKSFHKGPNFTKENVANKVYVEYYFPYNITSDNVIRPFIKIVKTLVNYILW